MMIWILLSFYFQYRAITENRNSLLLLIAGGVSLFLASLTKGVPGLFPIVVVPVYWLCTKKIKLTQAILWTSIVMIVPGFIYAVIILLNNSAAESLSIYFFERLLGRVTDVPVVDKRFYILYRLFMDILPLILLSGLIILFSYKYYGIKPGKAEKEKAAFLFLTGLAGSIPLMLTLVQKAFYYVPTIPFFALSAAVVSYKSLNVLLEKLLESSKRYKALLVTGVLLIVIGLFFTVKSIGGYSREKSILQDIEEIGRFIPEKSLVSYDSVSMQPRWSIRLYFERNEDVYFNNDCRHEFFINLKGVEPDSLLHFYRRIKTDTKVLDLYKKFYLTE
jgi:4-amino-4-deoxy-L-arabinose transferase-like glycosyltransferase